MCGQGSSEGEAEESSLDIILCFVMVPDNTITRTSIVSTPHQPTLSAPHKAEADISKILYSDRLPNNSTQQFSQHFATNISKDVDI